jgi:hypothetical protein
MMAGEGPAFNLLQVCSLTKFPAQFRLSVIELLFLHPFAPEMVA